MPEENMRKGLKKILTIESIWEKIKNREYVILNDTA